MLVESRDIGTDLLHCVRRFQALRLDKVTQLDDCFLNRLCTRELVRAEGSGARNFRPESIYLALVLLNLLLQLGVKLRESIVLVATFL